MPSIIHLLDDITINQIAAGEVIENPSSVIKELIENGLDAEATSISIEIEASGRHLIRVTDNGIGMSPQDALLCFERHATSKVFKIEDLDSLISMGFRGEALPSIASIAKVRLITRPRDQEKGTLIEIQGGKIISQASVPCEVGTSIEVTDLFYNVPARRKFLKSVKSDLLEIQKMVTEIAFGNVLVHFSLISDGSPVIEIPIASSHLQRAGQILNESIFEEMRPFEFQEGEIKLEGLLGAPTIHRPNRTGQSLFLNQRAVSSWEIAQAVLDGYGTSLPERRYPLFHIHLALPPHEFDINVHPQKKEVRFSHLAHLKDVVRKGVFQALHKSSSIAFEVETPPIIPKTLPVAYPYPYEPVQPIARERQPLPYFEREKNLPLPPLSLALQPVTPKVLAILPFYILVEGENGIQAVDIQKARKRIRYEEAMKAPHKIEKQLLLLPLTLTLSHEERHWLNDNIPHLEKAGFSIDGKEINGIPSYLREEEIEPIIHDMIRHKSTHIAEAAIRSIPKENRVLTSTEANHLISALYVCQQPHFTHAGQKIVAKITWEDFERFFK